MHIILWLVILKKDRDNVELCGHRRPVTACAFIGTHKPKGEHP